MTRSGERPIRLRGVRVHNLKGIDLDIPAHRWTTLTGPSGSGKSSLAFDTLYAEGRRRYLETFPAYARQFLDPPEKPDADRIDDIPPAVAVGQRVPRRSGRTTVGTLTETHDHLALLYARVGRVICRVCGAEVRPATTEMVIEAIERLTAGTKYLVTFPLEVTPETDMARLSESLRTEGFLRVRVDGKVVSPAADDLPRPADGVAEVVVDRLTRGAEDPGRRLDSIETAFDRGLGRCRIVTDAETLTFLRGWRCARCGTEHMPPTPALFRFNSPVGACPECEGFGHVIDVDIDRIVPDRSKSIREGAVAAWTTPKYREHLETFLRNAARLGVPVDVPFESLTDEQRVTFVNGPLRAFFRALERKAYKLHVRVFLSRWRRQAPCPACHGARLRPEALAVRVAGRNIAEVSAMAVSEAMAFVGGVVEAESTVARRILRGVRSRLAYLDGVGLGYLTLDRQAVTLSGGESRRVALTAALGSGLVNALYVLDEPSIGLHPRDVGRLTSALGGLRDAGNTLVVVEHERGLIEAADRVIEIGPGAGELGGEVVFEGTPADMATDERSVTGAFLSGRNAIAIPGKRRHADRGRLRLIGASGHNLKGIDVSFPLGVFCVVTGVSGSGKSTLIDETLYPALARRLRNEPLPAAPFGGLEGAERLGDVVLLDQTPIGRSTRSNPATYLGAFDEIRKAFAETHEAKVRNYAPSRFSFNVPGGRCESCEGSGVKIVDMQFLSDVVVTCPECRGKRFRPEVLEVKYRGKSIAEVLDLTAHEAFGFFRHKPKVQLRLRPLVDVGLDYLRIGQAVSTLSGGEAQRLKLAEYLGSTAAAVTRSAAGPKTLFLLDEPTTGLHPADIVVLLEGLNRLVDLGHSLIVVEHAPEVMAAADWIIDMGPEAGARGGTIVAEGTPEEVARGGGDTARVLAEYLARTRRGAEKAP